MREIKFRALTQEDTIIRDVGSIQFFEDGMILVNEEIPVKQLIEFTGLKDKNGKEIYEGDLFWDTWHQSPLLRVIEFSDGEFVARDTEHIIPMEHLRQWLDNGERKEVIGNIYENKELLKGDKND